MAINNNNTPDKKKKKSPGLLPLENKMGLGAGTTKGAPVPAPTVSSSPLGLGIPSMADIVMEKRAKEQEGGGGGLGDRFKNRVARQSQKPKQEIFNG